MVPAVELGIKDVAAVLGVSVYTLREWERNQTIPVARRTTAGRRVWTGAEIPALLTTVASHVARYRRDRDGATAETVEGELRGRWERWQQDRELATSTVS